MRMSGCTHVMIHDTDGKDLGNTMETPFVTMAAPFMGTLEESTAQWFLGNQVWQRAGGPQTDGQAGLIEQITFAGLGSPDHVHHREDEMFYVLEGELRFFSEGQTWVLGPGGFAFLPRNVPHGFRTEGNTAARSLLLVTPAGFEGFVQTLSTAEPAASPPEMKILMTTAARFGLDILGPLPE